MSDLIRREDVFEVLGITDKSTKYGGDHSGYKRNCIINAYSEGMG